MKATVITFSIYPPVVIERNIDERGEPVGKDESKDLVC